MCVGTDPFYVLNSVYSFNNISIKKSNCSGLLSDLDPSLSLRTESDYDSDWSAQLPVQPATQYRGQPDLQKVANRILLLSTNFFLLV